MNHIFLFFKTIVNDFNTFDDSISKLDKIKCYFRIISNLTSSLWSIITAPLIYPIWWIFRFKITEKIYFGTSWQEISQMIKDNQTNLLKSTLKKNGRFLFWLWTYGDQEDPLVTGGMPDWYGENNFYNRWRWAAFRNPRFNINYINFRTSKITKVITKIDKRDFNTYHTSKGIGDSPDGVYFKWMMDDNNKWYFIYENNTKDYIWYFGWTGLLKQDIGNEGGRFEFSLRKTESTYNTYVYSGFGIGIVNLF